MSARLSTAIIVLVLFLLVLVRFTWAFHLTRHLGNVQVAPAEDDIHDVVAVVAKTLVRVKHHHMGDARHDRTIKRCGSCIDWIGFLVELDVFHRGRAQASLAAGVNGIGDALGYGSSSRVVAFQYHVGHIVKICCFKPGADQGDRGAFHRDQAFQVVQCSPLLEETHYVMSDWSGL